MNCMYAFVRKGISFSNVPNKESLLNVSVSVSGILHSCNKELCEGCVGKNFNIFYRKGIVIRMLYFKGARGGDFIDDEAI